MSVDGLGPIAREPDDPTGYRRQAVRLADERDHWKRSHDSAVESYRLLAEQLTGTVDLDDPKLIETLARVIENRHGTLHGIGNTLREALAEIKRVQS